jgi:ketosteroid isomerase-like protein
VNHYTKDARIFPPNADVASGRNAIASLVSQYLKFGIREFRDSITALYGNQENLIEEGTFFMGDGKGKTIDKGKYVEVWRKEDGEWKLYSDIFNSSLPEATAGK